MIEIQRRQCVTTPRFSAAISPLLQRIYANRGIVDETQLERGATGLLHYDKLYGIEKALAVLLSALEKKSNIIVVGDFDADGATSSALCVSGLKMMGYPHVDYLVPNRFDDGYGLSPEVVEQVVAKGADLIITVDNGVSSIEGVAAAKALGLQVLVTDHHLPANQLPAADAIINPNLAQCPFESKALAGVGVAFYLMLALRARLRERNWFAKMALPEPNLAELLDLVALGTVADVVSLDRNNRILVHQGLMRIRSGFCRPGIQALIEVANRNMASLSATDLGFSLAPRLNAAGRLDDMAFGVELLLADNLASARQMAAELDSLNQMRKEIEQGMKQEAFALCDALILNDKTQLPSGLALYQQEWHQGVIGILASRLKDKFHRPVIAFAKGDQEFIKGSARSIADLHMRDTLDLIDTQHPGLIKKFGGHAMAAGLTIAERDFARFAQLFDQAVSELIEPHQLKGILLSDGALQSDELTLDIATLLRNAGPWGQGFAEPLFDGKFKLLSQKLVGEKHLKMVLEPLEGGKIIDAIAFNVDLQRWPDLSVQQIELAYRLSVNEFRGNLSVQLMVEYLNPL